MRAKEGAKSSKRAYFAPYNGIPNRHPPRPHRNRRGLVRPQQEDNAVVSLNEFGHWRPWTIPCLSGFCETLARELSRNAITWVAQLTKVVRKFLNLSGDEALICDVPTLARRDHTQSWTSATTFEHLILRRNHLHHCRGDKEASHEFCFSATIQSGHYSPILSYSSSPCSAV